MKTNINFRFALYVLMVTAGFAGLALSWTSNFPPLVGMLLYMLAPYARNLLGQDQGFFFKSNREASNRELIFGFLAFFVLFWVVGLYLGFHISSVHQVMHFMWSVVAILWIVFLYPGYRWWRAQTKAVAS